MFNRDQIALDIAPICETHTEHCLRCETLLGIIERIYWLGRTDGMDILSERMAEINRERIAKGAGDGAQRRG